MHKPRQAHHRDPIRMALQGFCKEVSRRFSIRKVDGTRRDPEARQRPPREPDEPEWTAPRKRVGGVTPEAEGRRIPSAVRPQQYGILERAALVQEHVEARMPQSDNTVH